MRYKRIVLGGTFDHFHAGHQKFLAAALENGETLSLGITLPILHQHKPLADEIQPYEVREEAVRTFLKERDALGRVTITPITNVYGTTLDDRTIDAIVVTPATELNAGLVNTERHKRQMPTLPIIVVPLVKGDDDKTISSERVRRGEIDRNGASYRKFFLSSIHYTLPPHLREVLQTPFGEIVTDTAKLPEAFKTKPIFSVGDIVSFSLLQAELSPVLCIIDYMTGRKHIDQDTVIPYFQSDQTQLNNPAGTINTEIIDRYDHAFSKHEESKKTQTIVVNGEEDLLALPIMLVAPLGSSVVYGLHDVGMIIVTVTEELKRRVHRILEQFRG